MGKKSGKRNQRGGAAERAEKAYRNDEKAVHTDVLGSYTGLPEDGGVPVQDADDL